jgi:integrase
MKRKLTELTRTKVKATNGRVEKIWDTKCHGLVQFVQPSGRRAYRFYYSVNGSERWYDLGDIYLADARHLVYKLRAKIADGRDPVAERRSQRPATTFAELYADYLEVAKRENRSWAQSDRLVRRHLLTVWAKRDIKAINRADVKAVKAKISAPVLANQTLKAASAIFGWAVEEEKLTINPASGVKHNETTSRDRVLGDSELPLFWEAFGKAGVPGKALQVALMLGQRPGEVAHMRYDQIANGGWWTLQGEPDPKTKWPGVRNGSTHVVWLPQPVRDIIDGLSDSDFVFGKPILAAMQETMKNIWEELKAPRTVPHDLRRTHGTTITRLGYGRPAMNRIQNHREGGIADVYDRHDYSRENKKIMESVARHIMAIVEGRGGDNVVRGKF